jgi:hypothetical protein
MSITVSIPDKTDTTTLGEMTGASGELGSIAEMLSDPMKLDTFSPGWGAKGKALAEAAGDEKPQFAVVRVEEGWSNSRRLWSAEVVESICEQTNALEPVGHLGHIEDDKMATAFPEPQTTWFAAKTAMEPSKEKGRIGEMVKTAYFAGYLLPGAKVRTLIPARAVRGISWWGTGDQVPVPGKGVAVQSFTLKALDWARKLAEGMPTSSVIAVTGEQEGRMSDKALSQVTPEEFKKENPNGYALLVSEATADKDAKIGEMEEQIKEGDEAKSLLTKVCEAVGLDADKTGELITKVTELKTKVGDRAKTTLDAGVAKLLAEKLPGDDDESKRKRELVTRLLPVGEMQSRVADAKDADEADKIIGEMVTEAFEKDDTIKSVVGEMQPPVVRRREELRGGDSLEGNEYVTQRERVTFAS